MSNEAGSQVTLNCVTVKVNDRTKTLRFCEALTTGSRYTVQVEGGSAVCGAESVMTVLTPEGAQLAAAELADGTGTLELDTAEMAEETERYPVGGQFALVAVLRSVTRGENVGVGPVAMVAARPGTAAPGTLVDYKGPPGDAGKSAFELAVEQGYTGTVAEWLASLKGEPGAPGAMPEVVVGTVTTTDPGTSAQVRVNERSTAEHVVLDFWIPKGDKGEPGEDASGPDASRMMEGIDVATNTTNGIRAAVKAIATVLGARTVRAAAALLGFAAVAIAADVQRTSLGDIDLDDKVVTNVTLDGLATAGEVEAATNALAEAMGDLAWKDGVSWSEIDGRPTNVSAFANDAGYLTEHQSLAGYATTGAVAQVAGGLVTHVTHTGNPHHVTAAQTGAYVKPASGIPLADLHGAVQTNIALAATAEQPETVRWSDDLNYNDNAGGQTGIWFRPRAFGMADGAFLSVVTIHTATTTAIDKTVVLKIYDITDTTVYATSTPNRINAVNADFSFAFQTKAPLMRDTQYILRFCNAGSGAYETVRLNQRVIDSPDLYFGETHSNWRPRVAVEWGYGIAAARAEIDGLKSGGNVTNMTVTGTFAIEDGYGGRIEAQMEDLGTLCLTNASGATLRISLPDDGETDYAERTSIARERIRSATNALAGALGDLAWKDDLTGLETDPVWLADKAGYQRRIPYCTCTSSADASVKVALPKGGATFTNADITTGAVVIVTFTNGNTYSEPWLQFNDDGDPDVTSQYKIRNRYGSGLFSSAENVCLVFNGTYWMPLHPLRAGSSGRNRYGLVALSDWIGDTNTTDAATIAAVTRVDERLTAATNALAGAMGGGYATTGEVARVAADIGGKLAAKRDKLDREVCSHVFEMVGTNDKKVCTVYFAEEPGDLPERIVIYAQDGTVESDEFVGDILDGTAQGWTINSNWNPYPQYRYDNGSIYFSKNSSETFCNYGRFGFNGYIASWGRDSFFKNTYDGRIDDLGVVHLGTIAYVGDIAAEVTNAVPAWAMQETPPSASGYTRAETDAAIEALRTETTNALAGAIETHRATELWGEGGTNYVNAAGELFGSVVDPDSSYWMQGTNVFGYVGRTDTSFHPAYVGYEWRCSSYDDGGGDIHEFSLWYSPTAGTVYLGVSSKELAPTYVGDQPTGLDPTVDGCVLTNFVAQYDRGTFEFHPAAKVIPDTPYDRYARVATDLTAATNALVEAIETVATNALAEVIEPVVTNLLEAIETHKATELWGEGGANYVNAAGELYKMTVVPANTTWDIGGSGGNVATYLRYGAFASGQPQCHMWFGQGTGLAYDPAIGTMYMIINDFQTPGEYIGYEIGKQPTGDDLSVLTNFNGAGAKMIFNSNAQMMPYDRYARDGEMSAALTNLLLRIEALERGGQ